MTLAACSGGSDHQDPPSAPVVTPGAPVSAATIAQIDDYLTAQMRRQHIPGMALVVTRDGQPILQKGYGLANSGTGAAMTPDTVMRIGSVTKQFTASAIMLLVQEGRVGLDQPLSQYFPTVPAALKAITVRQLLTHTSGLQRDLPVELLDQVDFTHRPPVDQLIALGAGAELAYPSGSAHLYSNVGYHILGLLIEKITGQFYADFLRQRFFEPLGMQSADIFQTTRAVPAAAAGYTWDGAALKPASTRFTMPGLLEGEGGLQMSAADLAKWDAALRSERFLSKASLAQMWTPARLNDGSTVPYGFGWVLGDINHHQLVQHNGQVEGFISQFARYPDAGLSVTVLVNTDVAHTEWAASRVAALVDPRLDWVTATDPHPHTGTLLRAIIDETARGALRVDTRFSPAYQAALTPDVVQEFTGYLASWAPIEQFGYIDQVSIGGAPVARYLVRSKYEQVVMGVALDAEGRIAYLGALAE